MRRAYDFAPIRARWRAIEWPDLRSAAGGPGQTFWSDPISHAPVQAGLAGRPDPWWAASSGRQLERPQLMRSFGAFSVRRGESDRDAVRTMRQLVRDGHALGLFVEGTRQRSGVPGPVQPGAAMVAINESVPVICAAIYGSFEWRLGNFSPVSVAWGAPLSFDGLPRGGKGYKEASFEVERKLRQQRVEQRGLTRPQLLALAPAHRIREEEDGHGGYNVVSTTGIPLAQQLPPLDAVSSLAVVDDTVFSGLTMRTVLQALPPEVRAHTQAFCLRGVAASVATIAALCPITAGFAAASASASTATWSGSSG
mgnify:CR=1 FL=1